MIGRVGEDNSRNAHSLGSQIEAVVRTIHRPILITASGYKKPEKVMLAFDGSSTAVSVRRTRLASR